MTSQIKDTLENTVAALRKEMRESNWPQSGDKYWFYGPDGAVEHSRFSPGYIPDDKRLDNCMCFKTRVDAEISCLLDLIRRMGRS